MVSTHLVSWPEVQVQRSEHRKYEGSRKEIMFEITNPKRHGILELSDMDNKTPTLTVVLKNVRWNNLPGN